MDDQEMSDWLMKILACGESENNATGGSHGNSSKFGYRGYGNGSSSANASWPWGISGPSSGQGLGSESDSLDMCNLSGLELGSLLGNDAFKKIMGDLNVYFTPVIILIGVAGNLLSFLVFTTTHLKRQSASIYLASLALVDILFLMCLSVVWLSWIRVPIFHRPGVCQLVVYLMYVSTFLSVWYVVSFTIERYIIVWYPLRKDRLCTPARATKVVGLLALAGLLLYSFSTVTNGVMDLDTAWPLCMPLPHFYTVTTVATALDSVITLIVPSVAIVVLNYRIVLKIMGFCKQRLDIEVPREPHVNKPSDSSSRSGGGERQPVAPPDDKPPVNVVCSPLLTKHHKHAKTFVYIPRPQGAQHHHGGCQGQGHHGCQTQGQAGGGQGQGQSPNSLTAPTTTRNNNNASQRSTSTRRYSNHMQHIRIAHGRTRAQYRTARMLIIVSSVFVILNLPSHVFRIHAFVSSSVDHRYVTNLRALRWQELFQLLYHLNFSINFFLYSACGRQFRTGLRILCSKVNHKLAGIKERWYSLGWCIPRVKMPQVITRART